jgi:hypothetical protein
LRGFYPIDQFYNELKLHSKRQLLAERTILRIEPYERLANQMAQLMLCLDIRRNCRQPIEIEGFNIPEWGLEAPLSDAAASDIIIVDQRTRRWAICQMIDALKPRLIHVKAMTFRIKNFSAPELYDRYFPTAIATSQNMLEDTLLVHIRAGDVATLTHSSYGPLPISYYQYLAKSTGLKLAFVGELSGSNYVQALRVEFPDSNFLEGGSPLDDFQTLRRAENVAIAVSSFSWMATFLSRQAKAIHIPLAGLFDPLAAPHVDFLPLADKRVTVHQIPKRAWQDRYSDHFARMAIYQPASKARLRALKLYANARQFFRTLRIHLGLLRRMMTDHWASYNR